MAYMTMTNMSVQDTMVCAAVPNVLNGGTKGTHMKYMAISTGHSAMFLKIYLVRQEQMLSRQAATQQIIEVKNTTEGFLYIQEFGVRKDENNNMQRAKILVPKYLLQRRESKFMLRFYLRKVTRSQAMPQMMRGMAQNYVRMR